MLEQLWKIIVRVSWILLAFGVFLVGLYLFRNFVFFYQMSPTAGWCFATLVGTAMLAAVLYLWIKVGSYPCALTPPSLPLDLSQATHKEKRSYCKYLVRYMRRLSRNTKLEPDIREHATTAAYDLDELLRSHPLNDDLDRAIQASDEEVISPALAALRDVAEREIRTSVRDVMLAVTLSPYPSIDLLVVLYRNLAMVVRLIGIYASRPPLREQFLILKDTLTVIATVNFLNLGRNLIESIFSQVPFIGRLADEIAQGLGAGFFTSACGHAAIVRCESFRGWQVQEAKHTLSVQSRDFLLDVKNIFTKDVLPNLKGRVKAESMAVPAEDTNAWDAVIRGVGKAVDGTASALEDYIVRPANTGTRKVVDAGSSAVKGVARAGSSIAGLTHRHTQKAGSEFTRAARRVGQRLKYGRRGSKLPNHHD